MCGGHLSHVLTPLLESISQADNQPPSPVAVIQPMNCSTCGSAVSPEFAWCPKCGAALKAHPCAYCGQILDPEDKVCSACGAPTRSL